MLKTFFSENIFAKYAKNFFLLTLLLEILLFLVAILVKDYFI